MTTLEKIRAEIQSNFENSTEPNNIDAMMRNIGREECLEIIDKYAEQEPNRDTEEIAEILKSDADAETKCKMISNILTAKPHYFAEQEPKTGHWIMNRQLERRTCDNCNKEYRWSFYPHNYCPNCGACMKDGRTLDEFIEDSKLAEHYNK